MSYKTIAISAHKGGVGKTVTSMALASAMARESRRTLLLDLDPQAHSTMGLGLEVQDGDPTLRDLLSEPALPIARATQATHLANLSVVPSHIRLARLAPSLYMRPRREEILKRSLQPVLNQYDVILLDCPPSLGALTEMAIAAADLVIIPCQMEARAADGLIDLLEVIGIIKGEKFEDWRVLLTRVDSRKSVTNEAVIRGLKNWQPKILKTAIPQSEPLNQSQMIAGTDIFGFDAQSKGALAYKELAKEIWELLKHGK